MAKYIAEADGQDEIIQATNLVEAKKKAGFWKRRNKLTGRLTVRKMKEPNISGAKKADNIFVRAKAYQKLHPRTVWADCIQKVKGKKTVGGVKKKTVGSAAPKKRKRIAGTKIAATTRKIGTKVGKPAISGLQKASKLVADIARLEKKRKALKSRELRDIVQLEINAHHDHLDRIKKTYRKKSA